MKTPITAERIRTIMSIRDITAAELSERSGVLKSSVSQYVNGSSAPSNVNAGKLASVLGCNPVWLMGFDVPMNNDESHYLEDEAKDLAQFLYENPEYRVLFDASKKVRKSDIEFVKMMLDKFKGDD